MTDSSQETDQIASQLRDLETKFTSLSNSLKTQMDMVLRKFEAGDTRLSHVESLINEMRSKHSVVDLHQTMVKTLFKPSPETDAVDRIMRGALNYKRPPGGPLVLPPKAEPVGPNVPELKSSTTVAEVKINMCDALVREFPDLHPLMQISQSNPVDIDGNTIQAWLGDNYIVDDANEQLGYTAYVGTGDGEFLTSMADPRSKLSHLLIKVESLNPGKCRKTINLAALSNIWHYPARYIARNPEASKRIAVGSVPTPIDLIQNESS